MTVPMMCVFAAFGLIYAAHVPGLVARALDEGGFDNRDPRRQQARLTGFGARAIGGHANAHEAFAPFAAAVLVNHLSGGDLRIASVLSVAFVVLRVAYHVAYLLDVDYLRTLIWCLGAACVVGLFAQPLL